MANFDIELDGVSQTYQDLEEILDDVQTVREFTVGTGVEYSIYLEMGTSKMDAKPFFQPAIHEARLQGIDGFIAHNTQTTVQALDTMDQVLTAFAFALERRVKQIITDKTLVDTGTLRASVLAIPGDNPRMLPDASEFSGFDSENPAPPNAGRALVSETVEI